MIDLTVKATEIFEQNKAVGWWDDQNRCIFTTIQLINTEIAEATEGERKNLMDDHLPHRKMGEVELADALIRTLDLAGRFEVEVDTPRSADELKEFIESEPLFIKNIATAHLMLSCAVSELAGEIDLDDEYDFTPEAADKLRLLAIAFIGVALAYDYDIFGAMDEKLAYNKQRADHKRENRAKKNGKAF